jgi:hypothetical protein
MSAVMVAMLGKTTLSRAYIQHFSLQPYLHTIASGASAGGAQFLVWMKKDFWGGVVVIDG